MRGKIRRLTGCCVAVGAVVGAVVAVAGGSAAARVVRAVPHPSYAIYTVTVGITGRATQDGRWPCHGSSPCNWGGGLAKETYGATFHVDETFKNIILPKSGFSIPEAGAEATRHVVNGSYTETGQYDENGDGHLVSFSCSGRLGDSAAEGTGYNISGRPHGGSWAFSAAVLQFGLKGTTTSGGPSGSPCDRQASFVDGPSSSFGAPTWTASFKIANSEIGKQTITKLVTGPPTKYRPPSDCKDEGGDGGTCTFSLSWHGSVKFKRTH